MEEFPISRSINIKPWCAKIEDARQVSDELEASLDENGQLDFGDSKALNYYNKAVAKVLSDLDIQVPDNHLIPAVCLRYAYAKILVDNFLKSGDKIIEIGTGASAIISQILAKSFLIECVATEINHDSFESAKNNIQNNHLTHLIQLLKSSGQILHDLVEDTHYQAILTYPPTYSENVQDMNKLNKQRGFKGVKSEMIGGGDTGFEFTQQYLEEACKYSIEYVTVLCLFKNHVAPSIQILEKHERSVEVIELIAGTRKRYLVIGLLPDLLH